MPLSGWIMAGFFWAVILTGVALAVAGWRRGIICDQEARYVVLPERPPEPWSAPPPAEGSGPQGSPRP